MGACLQRRIRILSVRWWRPLRLSMLTADVDAAELLVAFSHINNNRISARECAFDDDDDDEYPPPGEARHHLRGYTEWMNITGTAPVLLQMGRRFAVPHDVLNLIASMVFRRADPRHAPLPRPNK